MIWCHLWQIVGTGLDQARLDRGLTQCAAIPQPGHLLLQRGPHFGSKEWRVLAVTAHYTTDPPTAEVDVELVSELR